MRHSRQYSHRLLKGTSLWNAPSFARPQSWRPDPDPVYKTNINLTSDNGSFQSFDVLHTVRSGAIYDRSQQYSDASIWKTNNRMEWFWRSYRGARGSMVGEVYWNSQQSPVKAIFWQKNGQLNIASSTRKPNYPQPLPRLAVIPDVTYVGGY
jgi:hypothetical protein